MKPTVIVSPAGYYRAVSSLSLAVNTSRVGWLVGLEGELGVGGGGERCRCMCERIYVYMRIA